MLKKGSSQWEVNSQANQSRHGFPNFMRKQEGLASWVKTSKWINTILTTRGYHSAKVQVYQCFLFSTFSFCLLVRRLALIIVRIMEMRRVTEKKRRLADNWVGGIKLRVGDRWKTSVAGKRLPPKFSWIESCWEISIDCGFLQLWQKCFQCVGEAASSWRNWVKYCGDRSLKERDIGGDAGGCPQWSTKSEKAEKFASKRWNDHPATGFLLSRTKNTKFKIKITPVCRQAKTKMMVVTIDYMLYHLCNIGNRYRAGLAEGVSGSPPLLLVLI